MSRHGDVTLDWGDGRYKFRLGYGEMLELQEICDAGPAVIAHRLRNDTYRVQDYRETLRIGLIGGGVEQGKALRLIKRFVDNQPPAENLLHAWIVLNAFLIGVSEEEVGKLLGDGETMETSRSPEEKSGLLQ
jgi:hypothetical protein